MSSFRGCVATFIAFPEILLTSQRNRCFSVYSHIPKAESNKYNWTWKRLLILCHAVFLTRMTLATGKPWSWLVEMIQIKGLLSIQRLAARRTAPVCPSEVPPRGWQTTGSAPGHRFPGATLARPWSAGLLPPPRRIIAAHPPAAWAGPRARLGHSPPGWGSPRPPATFHCRDPSLPCGRWSPLIVENSAPRRAGHHAGVQVVALPGVQDTPPPTATAATL